MKKKRTRQLLLILITLGLTAYNILPTLFYYAKPLQAPITEERAHGVIQSIVKRNNQLEVDTEKWLSSFCKWANTPPLNIQTIDEAPHCIRLSFQRTEDADRFRSLLPKAGAHVLFAPSRLSLAGETLSSQEVIVQRPLWARLDPSYFEYTVDNDTQLLFDRAEYLGAVLQNPAEFYLDWSSQGLETLASYTETLQDIFTEQPAFLVRFVQHLNFSSEDKGIFQPLLQSIDQTLEQAKKDAKDTKLASLKKFVKAHQKELSSPKQLIENSLMKQELKNSSLISLKDAHPLFSSIEIQPEQKKLLLHFHKELIKYRHHPSLERLFLQEVARLQRATKEQFEDASTSLVASLYRQPNTQSFLVLKLDQLAHQLEKQLIEQIRLVWNPQHPDLKNLAIVGPSEYELLSEEDKNLCLMISSSLGTTENPFPGKPLDSIYFLFKGLNRLVEICESYPDAESSLQLQGDLRSLFGILERTGCISHGPVFKTKGLLKQGDFLFEIPHFAAAQLAATRENFSLKGSHLFAGLELSNVEERILTENRIDTQIHEELLKWHDEYKASQVALYAGQQSLIPPPPYNALWKNCLLSWKKLIRGDHKKILRWGLDLSGGKTVQIALMDHEMQPIEDDAAIQQGINDLYARVNKMGVSEVSIRQVGRHIVLDFPGSQNLSAAELIQASTMHFHVVNETFSLHNSILAPTVNHFLQEVWNEASVLQMTDPEALQRIAEQKLHPTGKAQRSEVGEKLFEEGLRFISDPVYSGSKIVRFKGSDPQHWHGQSHPLMIVFKEAALEGNSLENIRVDYDPVKGNFLSFDIQSGAPQEKLWQWTGQYCKDTVACNDLGAVTSGQGWRMAVLLNHEVISCPTLDSALKNSAMISGHFTPREVSHLAADLKAGSLTFTPTILSEKNVSPELGSQDRSQGIFATVLALVLVFVAMVAYYRFAGFIASVAVFFNLLIMWAVLQNLGAALTLAGLAGVILTVGMAVDANVLVFERIKEEFALTKNIRSAIEAGYQKAYTAILDSNITTIIAGLILLQFDAGPIKSFATNLIIGIASSMFTALFMTRFYFTGWMQNPKHTTLKMANWIKDTQWNFLKGAKPLLFFASCVIVVGGFFVIKERSTIFGMDFTGGYSLNIKVQPASDLPSYKQAVENALLHAGLLKADLQVRELSPSHHLRLFIGHGAENLGAAFHEMPLEEESATVVDSYQKNPRIVWILKALEKENLRLEPDSLSQLHTEWSAMSGQMSQTMRNHALLGLLLSGLAIFLYISFRFESQFAASALLCLLHDVLITIGCLGILHALGVGIQIDLNTIAALMTIIGYSLNDTIIIFDRIREELALHPHQTLRQVANRALNATLSRTTITSATTLLVLIALTCFGGSSIFGFALVMSLGVFFGTLSSWFIATPLAILFRSREEAVVSEA